MPGSIFYGKVFHDATDDFGSISLDCLNFMFIGIYSCCSALNFFFMLWCFNTAAVRPSCTITYQLLATEIEFLIAASPLGSSMSSSTTLLRSNKETHLQDVEAAKPKIPESSCDSPIVISCTGHCQNDPEGNRVSQFKTYSFPIGAYLNFLLTGGGDDNIKIVTLGLKESSAPVDDRSFASEVGRVESVKVADYQLKTFPGLQAPELHDVIYTLFF